MNIIEAFTVARGGAVTCSYAWFKSLSAQIRSSLDPVIALMLFTDIGEYQPVQEWNSGS